MSIDELPELGAYLLTDQRRAEVESALYGDLEQPTLAERLERVCDALYWNEIAKIRGSKRRASQGTADFMTAEMSSGRTKRESREVLLVLRKRLNEAIDLGGDDLSREAV